MSLLAIVAYAMWVFVVAAVVCALAMFLKWWTDERARDNAAGDDRGGGDRRHHLDREGW